MKFIKTLWKFGRPHTIIGSVISIFTLFYIASETEVLENLFLVTMSIVIGITCNVFIVGINQIEDVEIDKINKPFLPIPAGDLTKTMAWKVVMIALFISLSLSLLLSFSLFLIVALAALIGWAYSRPPFYFKKHHLSAALSIVLVRGVLINVGGYMVFRELLGKDTDLSMNMLVLSAFVIIYTFVISWFKDLSDVKGDSAFKIKTLAIVWTPKLVLRLGVFSVGFAYVSSILMFMILCYFDYYFNTNHKEWVLLWGHLVLFVLFIINAFQIKLKDVDSIRRFYKRFWLFFFAEYLLFLFAYVFFY